MSMFYELMMRKKTEYLYPVIKGSLTESPYGVFSGFSETKYLALQEPFKLNANTVAEFIIKTNFSANSTGASIVGTFGYYGILINIDGDKNLRLYIGDGINNSWNILNSLATGEEIPLNTDYWVKLIFNKGIVSLLVSTDGINYSGNSASITLSQEYTYNLTYGIGRVSSTFLYGSIDLNNSYIKLGSTKYKLQAVVGYTVVGSPTISDGVVSGFSDSNYLKVNKTISWDTNTEIVCTFTMPNSSLTNTMTRIFIGKYSTSPRNGFTIYTTGGKSYIYAMLRTTNGDVNTYVSDAPLELGQKYTAKLVFNGSSYVLQLWQNGVKLGENTISSNETMATVTGFYIGSFEDANFFTGSIDLNETYIKINNKLWFNGQSAQ